MKITQYKLLLLLSLSCMTWISCKKFIEVEPPATNVNEGNVYESDGTAISAVIGIYTTMSSNNFPLAFSFFPELSADNMRMLNTTMPEQIGHYQNNLLPGDRGGAPQPWLTIYPEIFKCNAAIKGLNESKLVSSTVKQNLLGQAYFLRAFLYFYLTNFYGDVPLALSTDYLVNNSLKKTLATEVYNQIIADLKQAQSLLPEGYLSGDMRNVFSSGQEQRVTPNRYAASALLARVYLYLKDWTNAEAMATEVIGKTNLYSASTPLDQIFLKNSKETIWALQPVAFGGNSAEAEYYVLRPGEPTVNSGRSAFLSPSFMAYFQTGDQRKSAWISTITTDNVPYSFPAKYKALFNTGFTEQSILLRLAEQYLIRAEARIHENKVSDGIADLNVLRDRAIDKSQSNENLRLKLLPTSLSKEEAITALNYERRVELFSECAHRWFDLKRTGQINDVMTTATQAKGGTWSAYKALYPVPADELINNKNLVQNEGYKN